MKGWEILKMIDEGKKNIAFEKANGTRMGCLIDGNGYLRYEDGSINVSYAYLMENEFVIKKKYLTFDEARKSGKRFKHKQFGCDYMRLHEVIGTLRNFSDKAIDELLDEKAWEVED